MADSYAEKLLDNQKLQRFVAGRLGVADEGRFANETARNWAEKNKYEDSAEDTLRHILLGGLLQNVRGEGIGRIGKGIAGKWVDLREGTDKESLIDIDNNNFGKALRQQLIGNEDTSVESFVAEAKKVVTNLVKNINVQDIKGISPRLSTAGEDFRRLSPGALGGSIKFQKGGTRNMSANYNEWFGIDQMLREMWSKTKTDEEREAIANRIKENDEWRESGYRIEPKQKVKGPYKNVFERERLNRLKSEGEPDITHLDRAAEREGDSFAQGGDILSSDDQMDVLGLVEESNDVDPVSGNEIPLGATAEGVRDDQVAALSAGEFVIPDYAVRYHGLDFYMDSLQVAKEGLSQMDQMGMTGKPDEATMSDDTPLPTTGTGIDELEKLSSVNQKPEIVANRGAAILSGPVLNYANGGAVPAQAGGLQQVGLLNQPMAQQQASYIPTVNYANVAPATITDSMLQAPSTTSAGTTQAYPPIARPITQPVPEASPREIGPTPYEDYGPPTQIKAYRNPETGHVVYIPETFYGDPLQQPPAGYERVDQVTTPVTPPVTPPISPTPKPIDETEQMLKMEAEAEADTAQREEEQKAWIEERVNAVNAALAGDPTGAYMEAEGDTFNVDKKYGMFINGEFITDARILKDHAHRGRRGVITNAEGFKNAIDGIIKSAQNLSIPAVIFNALKKTKGEIADDGEVDPTTARAETARRKAIAEEQIAGRIERMGQKKAKEAITQSKKEEEALKRDMAVPYSDGGLVKKPTRKRTRKKNGKGLAKSK